MSERGVFAVDRGIFDHPMFAAEDFTEREAWLWLISTAVWKPAKVRTGHKVVALERGQLMFSERFIAQKWGWSKTCVRRFLMRLEREQMIVLKADHDATRITICNYERYAFGGTEKRTTNGPLEDHDRTKEEEPKKVIKEDDGGGARAKLVSDEAQETADALAAACGFPDPQNCPMGWYGAASWVQKCFNEGWPAELMITAAKETSQRKRDGPIEHFKYLEKPLAKAIAEHLRPLPKIEHREAETVVSYGISKTESLSHVARRHAEAGISFGEKPTAPGLCLVASGADVRLLPKSRSE